MDFFDFTTIAMKDIMFFLGILISLLSGAFLGWGSGLSVGTRKLGVLETKVFSFTEQNRDLHEQTELLQAELDLNRSEIERLSGGNAAQQEKIHSLEEKIEERADFRQTMAANLEQQFQKQADTRGKESESQEPISGGLTEMLSPLASQITELCKIVEKGASNKEKDQSSALEMLRELGEYTSRIDSSANVLVNAVKQEHVDAGWSEAILGRILEMSGLSAGREYRKVECSSKTGATFPDTVISLPGQRDILVATKVVLNNWNNYLSAKSDAEKEKAGANLVQDLRNQINALGKLDYSKVPGVKAVEMVFLFVPIEAAWMYVMQKSPELASYAQERKVVLVSASNMLLSLKLIDNIWRNEDKYSNTDAIIDRAHLLYKKWQSFTEDMARIGSSLEKSQSAYQHAMQRLSSGRGNMVRQAEELIKLGVPRPAGKLPESIAEGMFEEDINIPSIAVSKGDTARDAAVNLKNVSIKKAAS